jgi:cytochrome P450
MAKRRLSGALAAILKSSDHQRQDNVVARLFHDDKATSSESLPSSVSDDRSANSSEHAINQALELLFGGQETLSAMITCLIMLMAPQRTIDNEQMDDSSCDQPVFDKMVDEVRRMSDCEAELDDVSEQLVYVEAVIKEVLRLWPPIGGGYRRAKRTFSVAVIDTVQYSTVFWLWEAVGAA